jgi:Tfp pilus assembly protein PilP
MTANLRWTVVLAGLALAAPGARAATGQKPAPARDQAPPPTATAAAAPSPSTAAEGYSYKPEGRRDPFMSLTARLVDARAAGKRPDGLAGAMVGEIVLKGILQNRGTSVAVVQAPDGKTYLVHAGERLLDGVVKAITPDSLVILQEVTDPLSLVKQREVRKSLRVVEEVK